MMKFLKWAGVILVLAIIILSVFVYSNLKDRNPGYEIDLRIKSTESGTFKAGFSAFPITPEIPDQWYDANTDSQYDPKDGDVFTDGNGNGVFDAVWMAGFNNKRAANAIHDDLWARTMVIDDGVTRFALTIIDAIGLFHNGVIDIRNKINPEAGINYSIVSSTHTHEAPDLMGLWGTGFFKSGVNKEYLAYVKNQVVRSIETAAADLQPVSIRFTQDLTSLSTLVTDTRKPFVLDDGLRLMQVINNETKETLGTLIAWANHPETLWSDNLLITSDFPHFVREGIENGIYSGDSLVISGLGGIAIYFNGAIGGLMTTHPDFPVYDPWSGDSYLEPGFEKARSQGLQIAFAGLKALERNYDSLDLGNIRITARTIYLPLDNPLFRIGAALGILNRGFGNWGHMRTEIACCTIGPASFLTYPGEVYPELINGGIESPDGQDFLIDPVEVPATRDMIKETYKFIIGLGNDELGYIIPESEWDEDPPYTYGENESPYGEINSLGPETSPILYRELQQLIKDHYN